MTTNDHNEKQMMQFTMASRVPDLLMSPVFDPPDVHWFAAGNNDGTWLEIVKSNGRLHLYPWQMGFPSRSCTACKTTPTKSKPCRCPTWMPRPLWYHNTHAPP